MTAIDVVRRGLGSGDRPVPGTMSDEEFAAFAALADLEALVEAAKEHLRPDVWIHGHPYHGPTLGVETATTTSENLRAALARVLGTEQDTA